MEKQAAFPKTLQDAIKFFADLDTCTTFMAQLRWPEGVTCPICEGKAVSYLSTRRLWKCKACKKQFSVKQGTVMEDSPIGLDKWLAAMWLISNAKNGISSCEIHRALGITQKSAWFLLHRIRLAMQNGTFEKMTGQVEGRRDLHWRPRPQHAQERAQPKDYGHWRRGQGRRHGAIRARRQGESESDS